MTEAQTAGRTLATVAGALIIAAATCPARSVWTARKLAEAAISTTNRKMMDVVSAERGLRRKVS
jgi:hypothetical protein